MAKFSGLQLPPPRRALPKPSLKVRAVAGHQVQDYKALREGVRRVVGQVFDNDLQNWIVTGLVVEVPDTKEYRDEIKAGTLEPADEATCVAVGLLPVVYHFV